MPDDPTGGRPPPLPGSPVTRLADLLAEAGGGARPGPREIAELLWLAGQLGQEGDHPHAAGRPAPAPAPAAEALPPPAADPAPPAAPSPTAPPGRTADDRVPLHLPAPLSARRVPGAGGHSVLSVPAPPMLPHPLTLQRALRPLKRRVAAPSGHLLAEEATAHRIAALGAGPGAWLPVLRPASERWLRLNLVHDTGPTMPVWRPLIRELRAAVAQSGIFRTVTVHRAGPDGRVRHEGTPAPADGRTVTLVVSDGMGPQWRPGPAGDRWYAQLRRWGARMPLAVVQPLPEHLWRTTALPTTAGLLTAPAPAAPNATLSFAAYDDEPAGAAGLPLPVLEPAATWLAHWAQLVADAGGRQLPVAVARLGSRPAPPGPFDGAHPDRLTAADLVLRFRSLASPAAFRLAGHLAVGRPELPVMRLVQAAVEPHPRPQHLAEVILSGVLTTPPSAPPGTYAFRPGVRELLLRTLPRTAHGRTQHLLARVGGLIDARAGISAGEFAAVVPGDGDAPAPEGDPFATVSEESVRRLGGTGAGAGADSDTTPGTGSLIAGRYEVGRAIGRHRVYWSARDLRTGETVVLRLGDPDFSGWSGELPHHPNLVRVLDVGRHEGRPYMVMEHIDGPNLASYRGDARGVEAIAIQLFDALTTLHDAGMTHGRLVAENILIAPDGTPKISGFALHDRPGRGRTGDRRALGHILKDLADSQGWSPFVDTSGNLHSLLRELESGGGPRWLSPAPPPYRTIKPVGFDGTMWRARNTETGQDVVVQAYPHHRPQEHGDFDAWARKLAALRHENVVPVLDWGSSRDCPYLVTEWVPGTSLMELLAQNGWSPLPRAQLLPIARQLALAVRTLHAEGLPHGDLTAAHVRLAAGNRPVLCGFAHGSAEDAALTDDLDKLGAVIQAMATGALTPDDTVHPGQLTSAPAPWRGELARIVNHLRSGRRRQAQDAVDELAALDALPDAGDRTARLYRLFGTARIQEGRTQTTIGRPGSVEEAVFCALLLRPDEHLTYEELLSAAEVPPDGTPAEVRLRGCVELLRRELGDDVLWRTPAGLGLHLLGADSTDVLRAQEYDTDARRALDAGEPAESRRLLAEACDLTREEPLRGVRGPVAADARNRLLALSMTLQLTRAELDLAQDRFALAADDLEEFLLQHPGHPQAVRLRMTALRSLGRRSTALSVYQEYAERLPSPTDVDPAVGRLYREMRESAEAHEVRLLVEFTAPPEEGAHPALSGLLTAALTDTDTAQVLGRVTRHPTAEGHEVAVTVVEPRSFLLRTALAELGNIHRRLPGGPPLRALLGLRPEDVRGAWDEQVRAPLALGLSDELYQSLVVGSRLADPRLFRPLTEAGPGGAGDTESSPLAWYCTWRAPDPSADRMERRFTLPSSDADRPFTAHVEFSWEYVGPQRTDGRETDELMDAFREAASRITRRHPPDAAATALRRLRAELPSPRSPRVAAKHGILSLSQERPLDMPATRHRRPRSQPDPLGVATAVLFGFDGPLVQLYPGRQARAATRELITLLTELRDVGDALDGEPLSRRLHESGVHPLDVLRTYADHGPVLVDALSRRLDAIESRAVRYSALRNPHGTAMLAALHRERRHVAVVSDTSTAAMRTWLRWNGDVTVNGGVYGRTSRLDRLMPDPHCLTRALEAVGGTRHDTTMIGSSVAEFKASRELGLHFIGYARDAAARRPLHEAGCEVIVDSLAELPDLRDRT